MTRNILFVDDDSNVLDGLRRMLRSMRNDWQMNFAESGDQALELAKHEVFDVIVTDMRMPGMDGATLLKKIQESSPYSVRLVLSGQAEEESVLNALRVAHQYVAKPCDAERLKERINRACTTREILGQQWIKEIISHCSILSSHAHQFESVIKELSQPDPSLTKIGEIISHDVAMTARCLQITNSSFFGHSKTVWHAAEATQLLGLDTLKVLANKSEIFQRVEVKPDVLSLEALNHHSLDVAQKAEAIAKREGLSEKEVKAAFSAGLLHEIGRILLAMHAPEKFQQVQKLVEAGTPLPQAEKQIYGATHPEVGGYLLALWGLPDAIVNAVAYHHNPFRYPGSAYPVLTAVHVANVLTDELSARGLNEPKIGFDYNYLEQQEKENAAICWRDAAQVKSVFNSSKE